MAVHPSDMYLGSSTLTHTQHKQLSKFLASGVCILCSVLAVSIDVCQPDRDLVWSILLILLSEDLVSLADDL